MSIVLRDYQEAAVRTTLDAVKSGLHPVIALPTGAGKSLCCAALCTALAGRVLVASHRQELLEQDAAALHAYAPDSDLGLYSAGLRRRDVHQRVIFGGVQSIYTKMDALQAAGCFAAIIVDEAHLVAPQDADTVMYNAVFAACPDATRIGLSATPYRLDSGLLTGELRALVNCLVLTTGFDYPAIDLVVMLRPSMSKGLILQQLGRGCRQAQGKVDCLVLDYAGNIERHSPLDELWDLRKTPARQAHDDAEAAEKQQRQAALAVRHARQTSRRDPFIDESPDLVQTYTVTRVQYAVAASRNSRYPGTAMLVAKYCCPDRAQQIPRRSPWVWQWICLEYSGWARSQAEQWCRRRGVVPVPSSAQEAYQQAGHWPVPVRLRVTETAPYPKILLEHFADEPEHTQQQGRLVFGPTP